MGFDYPLLSSAWKTQFGEDAFKARINRLKGLASKRSHDNGTRKKADFREVEITCTECKNAISIKAIAACQMDASKFICEDCSGDRDCPICGQRVNGEKGLIQHLTWRRKAGSVEHISYEDSLKPVLIEGEDYVVCLECGAEETSLGAHLVKHAMSADSYREKHGSKSPIHSEKTKRKKSLAARSRADYGKGSLKSVACPDCGSTWIGSKFLVPDVHDLRCESCRKIAAEEARVEEDLKWSQLKEPEDYVTCLDCGYRAENLVSHILSAHQDYRVRYPESEIVSLNSAIRDKTHLKGVPLSDSVRKKMSENAGRWAEGLSKHTDERIARAALKMRGRTPWSKGLSKETDPRLEATSRANISHFQEHPRPRVIIDKEVLGRFRSRKGKVLLRKASEKLNHCSAIIRRECVRQHLEFHSRLQGQHSCLEIIADIVGTGYKSEWSSRLFCDAVTGHRYKFDGFFKELGLVVEFQGHQHYTFPNRYHKTLEDHEDCRRRDRAKKAMTERTPGLTFFEVFEYEPFTDESYMRGRLHQAGFIRQAIADDSQTEEPP
jgi:predicted transcriptional regulator